jgi:hypothetical protein
MSKTEELEKQETPKVILSIDTGGFILISIIGYLFRLVGLPKLTFAEKVGMYFLGNIIFKDELKVTLLD